MIVDETGGDFLNVRETARRLGVHENTVRNWAREGILQSARVPGSRFLRCGCACFGPTRRRVASGLGEERGSIDPEIGRTQLRGWLQQTPAVHQWISEQLGRRPRDVETLEQWWQRFQARTEPELPGSLFLAGRTYESDRLAKFLREHPEVVAVQAAWRDDAIAFVCATIEMMGREGHSPQPPLVVSSEEVWDRVVVQPGRMTLLPMFDGANFSSAIEHGHYVVVPLRWEQVVQGEHINLPRPDREAATKALESVLDAAGADSDAAYRLAAQARRSMPSLIRKLARDPAFARPAWSQPPDASTFAPLVLVGAWETNENDLDIVSRVVDKSWPTIERDLLHWLTMDDPPFVHPGSQWHLTSADEAFLLLRDALTATDLARWYEAVTEVLLEADPKLELEPNHRPMASLRGAVRKHSSVLRQGMAQGIALLGSASGAATLADGASGVDHARRAVREILSRANDDSSGRTWCSLSEELRLLAEAAPEEFLDAVHVDLDRDQPVLRITFQDGEQTSALFSSSPHTGLLWALEVLCWSPDYLFDATRALARLSAIDPGGQLSNRPLASLASVLVGWIRHTSASMDAKVQALEQIGSQQPEVAWELVLELWPSNHAIASPPSSPKFHDWKPENRNVLAADWVGFISQLVGLAIQLAGTDSQRWAKLSEFFGPLPPAERERLLESLEQFVDSAAFTPADRLELWERIDREIARHRKFPSADWSMGEQPLSRMQAIADQLEPKSDVARFGYLFDWHPDLPDVDLNDDGYDQKLAELRVQAVKETLDSASLDGLQALAERSTAPNQLGWVVGEVAPDELTGNLMGWLDSNKAALSNVAQGWASRKLSEHGVPWLLEIMERPEAKSLRRRNALALAAPATRELWDAIRGQEPDLSDAYWSSMNPWRVKEQDAEYATQELLRHDRPWSAVDMLTAVLHGTKEKPAAIEIELVEQVLDAALVSDQDDAPSQSPGYEIGVLLDFLETKKYSADKLARYEFAFFRLLEHSRRRPRALYSLLANDPGIFVDLVSRVYRGKNATTPAAGQTRRGTCSTCLVGTEPLERAPWQSR